MTLNRMRVKGRGIATLGLPCALNLKDRRTFELLKAICVGNFECLGFSLFIQQGSQSLLLNFGRISVMSSHYFAALESEMRLAADIF